MRAWARNRSKARANRLSRAARVLTLVPTIVTDKQYPGPFGLYTSSLGLDPPS